MIHFSKMDGRNTVPSQLNMTIYQRVLFGSVGDTVKTGDKVPILISFTTLLKTEDTQVWKKIKA